MRFQKKCSSEDEHINATEELVKLQQQGKLSPEQLQRFLNYKIELHQAYLDQLKKLRDLDKAAVAALLELIEKYGHIKDYVGIGEEDHDGEQKGCSGKPVSEKKPKNKKKNKRAKPRGGRNKGTGNKAAKDYPHAERLNLLLGTAAVPGAACPCCKGAKLYSFGSSEQLRFLSSPELVAIILDIQKSRCTSCGTVFGAELPDVYAKENCVGKFSADAAAQIIFTKYGAGIPNARLQTIQGYHDTPIADSTLWSVTLEAAAKLSPLWSFFAQANADAENRMVDDGSTFIIEAYLEIQDEIEMALSAGFKKDDVRTGQFITCWKFTYKGEEYRFFAAGREHQGEREFELQKMREAITPLVRMSDAGSTTGAVKPMSEKNEFGFTPQKTRLKSQGDGGTLKAYCLQHLRMHIEEARPGFIAESNFLMEKINRVFALDRETRQMNDDERLAYHQQHSRPLMDSVYTFVTEQKESNKKAEPNSLYGKLLNYIINQWAGFTLFLQIPGVELSTNDVERDGVKFTKRHKKASLGFQTYHGADVGCFFMSLIATCLATKKNPIHYLTTIIAFASHLTAENAGEWIPQKYEETAKKYAQLAKQNTQGYRILHRAKKDPDPAHSHPPPNFRLGKETTAALN